MKKSASDIVFLIFKVIILVVITLYLAYCIILMVASVSQETGWEAIGFVLVFAFGVFVNGGALILSLVLLAFALVFKGQFIGNTEKETEDYEKCLKIKKRNVRHFAFLAAYAVLSEIIIFAVGSIIF